MRLEGCDEEDIAAALGCVALVLILISRWLQVCSFCLSYSIFRALMACFCVQGATAISDHIYGFSIDRDGRDCTSCCSSVRFRTSILCEWSATLLTQYADSLCSLAVWTALASTMPFSCSTRIWSRYAAAAAFLFFFFFLLHLRSIPGD